MIKHELESLKIFDGMVTYYDFDIDESISFEEQKYSYKEDILQIKFGDRFILDVGWYPEFESQGNFLISAIQDNDWMDPVLKTKCYTLEDLMKAIESTAIFIQNQRKIKALPYRNVEYDNFE